MIRKSVGVLSVLLTIGAILMFANGADSGTLSWTAPSTYTDGSAISAASQASITYIPYYGASQTGPWVVVTVTAPGALTATVPDPAPGGVMWYTIDATLDGQTSEKAPPISNTMPHRKPGAPWGLTVS